MADQTLHWLDIIVYRKTFEGETFAVFTVLQSIAKVFPLNHLLCIVKYGHGLMHHKNFPVNSVF